MTAAPALALSGSNLTGEHAFSCCLRLDGELHTSTPPGGQRGDLAAMARDLLVAHGLSPQDLSELRVDLGPGSYTGLRVALTFVRFVQHFGDQVTALAIDSLSLLASTVAPTDGQDLRPLLDARRGRFHTARLRSNGGELQLIDEPRAVAHDELLATIGDGDTFVVSHRLGAEYRSALLEHGAEVQETADLTAAQLFDPALTLRACAPEQLEPRYLMATYAED